MEIFSEKNSSSFLNKSFNPGKYSKKRTASIFLVIIMAIVASGGLFFYYLNLDLPDKVAVINCGETPQELIQAFLNEDMGYFKENLKVKENLLCISESFKECAPAEIRFFEDSNNYNLFTVEGVKEDKCIINYKSGDKGVVCKYSPSQTQMLYKLAKDNEASFMLGYGIAFGMHAELSGRFSEETFEQEIINRDTGEREKVICNFYTKDKKPEEVKKELPKEEPVEDLSTTLDRKPEEIKKELPKEEPAEDLSTFLVEGREVKQGVAYYNELNPENCLYSVYFSCDYFQGGCDDDSIMQVCKNSCHNTGGREFGTGSYARLQEEGEIIGIQCSCNQCLSIEGGKKDFQLFDKRCRDIFGENGINLRIRNTGLSDILRNDWVVHRINGEEVVVSSFNIKVGETGFIFTETRTKDNNYQSGEHLIEIGLSKDDIREFVVICP